MTEEVKIYSAGDNITICSVCEETVPGYVPITPITYRCYCDATFPFHQINAATIWNVCHNLGKYPSVAVIDSSGTAVAYPDVQHIDTNVLLITFSSPELGWAFLN